MMRTPAILLALVAVAAVAQEEEPQATAPAVESRPAKKVRKIILDEANLSTVHNFKVAPRLPITFEMPAAIDGDIICGDCLRESAAPTGVVRNLFRLDVFGQTRFTVKLLRYPGYQKDLNTELRVQKMFTPLVIHLRGDKTVNMFVAAVEDPNLADQSVKFVDPGVDLVAERIKEEVEKTKKSCEQSVTPRIQTGVSERFMRTFLGAHRCDAKALGPRIRREFLTLEIKEVCRFAGKLLIRFDLENRENDPFTPEVVRLRAGRSNAPLEPVDLLGRAFTRPQVEFQKVTAGVIEAPEPETPLTAFELTIAENGGRNREIALSFEY